MKIINLTLSVLLCASAIAQAEDGWVQLFNGKDLTGWRANFGDDSFHVVDGSLRVNSTGRCPHLFYVGTDGKTLEKFKNFELKAIVRGEPSSNSGIFFHTDEKLNNKQGHLASGYEVQLNTTEKEKRKTGSLYQVRDLAKSPINDQTKWFEIHVAVKDKQITVSLNGQQVVDYTEPAKPVRTEKRKGRLLRADGGAIALQAHDPNSTFYFKSVQVRRLP